MRGGGVDIENSDQTGNIDGVPLCLAAVFICSTAAEHQNLIKAKKVGAGERIPLRQCKLLF